MNTIFTEKSARFYSVGELKQEKINQVRKDNYGKSS